MINIAHSNAATRWMRIRLQTLRPRGWSEGDMSTVALGLLLAVALALGSIPAAWQASASRPAGPPAAVAVAPPPAPLPAVEVPPPAPLVPGSGLPARDALPDPFTGTAPAAEPATAPAAGPAPNTPPAAPASSPTPVEPQVLAALAEGSVPGALTVTSDGAVHAGTDQPADSEGGRPSVLLSWDQFGRLLGTARVPNQPSGRTRGITALGALPDGGIVVVDASSHRVLRYDSAARSWSVLVTIADVPVCTPIRLSTCQPGLLDTAPLLRGVATGPSGTLWVSDAGQGTVWRVEPGQPPEAWYQSEEVLGDNGLGGAVLDGAGSLLVTVTRTTAQGGPIANEGAGRLLAVPVDADGSAGAAAIVATFESGEDPVDVDLGASGAVYVALRGAHAAAVLNHKGAEQSRSGGGVLEAPAALQVGDGRLLVTTTAPRPAVVAFPLRDGPGGRTEN